MIPLFRRNKPGAETLYLRARDFRAVLEVIHDVRKSSICDVVVGGSLVQRAFMPDFGRSVAGKSLYDLDFVLPEGSLERCPVLPGIRDDFYVIDIVYSKESYYFGLIHRKTGIWTDVFSEPYRRRYKPVVLGSETCRASTVESQILWMARDMLSRVKKRTGIHRKHVARLRQCMQWQGLDHRALAEEFEAHRDYYFDKVPEDRKALLPTVTDYVDYAIRQGDSYPRSYDSWSKSRYPEESITTTNGISIESRATFRRLIPWHVREWVRRKLR